ncbi:MAG: SDR family NAD(P)-dependent oxidoreductase [Gammaproteobacteria bacterium]|nr:SDR family NAD(P)-dependent oxidoreductase [Pseudomonadales bacterium]MCP5348726.1 SDR family NAD(P)-dependent oxidoreductase [Pseudomonadales bacterium]
MWNEKDIGDQNGKLYIVTGGNTGLGFMTAQFLLRAGARVLFTARDPDRGKDALTRLQDIGGSRAQLRELDLSSLENVAQLARKVLEEEPHIDALVLNAGVALLPYIKTVDGLETQFAVNHLGHFALTLPLVGITKRVVVTSSGATNEATVPLRFDKLATRGDGVDYDPMHAYADSKLANVLFARGLKRRCPELEVVATHPGFTVTDLQRHSLKYRLLGKFLAQPVEIGALSNVRSAVDSGLHDLGPLEWVGPSKGRKGYPVLSATVCSYAGDKEAQDRLWELSESLTGVTLSN